MPYYIMLYYPKLYYTDLGALFFGSSQGSGNVLGGGSGGSEVSCRAARAGWRPMGLPGSEEGHGLYANSFFFGSYG